MRTTRPVQRHESPGCGIRSPMFRHSLFLALFAALAMFVPRIARAESVAPTPPMGWNSWDAYGLTIDEADYRANTSVLAGLKQYGWEYSVIDEGWYMQDPFAEKVADAKVCVGRERNSDAGVEPLPLGGERGGFQAAGRLGPCAGAQVRHPHCAGNSAPGGQGQSAHRRIEFSRPGRCRHCGDLPLGRGQLWRERQRRRTGLLRLDDEALCRLGARFHQG